MKPQEVTSPKNKISQVEVIIENDEFSIASFEWNGSVNRIGIRWNGDKNSIGYPQSRGNATWFVLPKQVALAYALTTKNARAVQVIQGSSDTKFI